jgi:hypothetical protein
MVMFRVICSLAVLSVVFLVADTSVLAQDAFVITPTVANDNEQTWIDFFSAETKIHLDLPAGFAVPQGFQTDSTKGHAFVLGRKVKVLDREGNEIKTLQVVYVGASEVTGWTQPPTKITVDDFGATLKGKVYQINCKTNAVTVDSKPALTSDPALQVIGRECKEARSAMLRGQAFSGMKVSDMRTSTKSDSVPLFSDELDQFAIIGWDIKLREKSAGPPPTAIFDVSASTDPSNPIGKNYSSYKGEFHTEDKGLVMDLTLTSSSSKAEQTPDKSQITSTGTLTITFSRRIL